MMRGFHLGKCIFITVGTILWNSDSPVSIAHDREKLIRLFFKIKSKQVFETGCSFN